MPSLPKLIIDFDGTLVCQNSARVLEEVIIEETKGLPHLILRSLYHPRTLGFIWPAFAVASRLNRGRDARLLLLLKLGQKTLREHQAGIFARTAARLTLTPELKSEYVKPFIILSTGLSPIIEAFLRLHPELPCQKVIAAPVTISSGRIKAHLAAPRSKASTLATYTSYRYLTDYDHEVQVLQSQLPEPLSLQCQKLSDGRTIYTLATSN